MPNFSTTTDENKSVAAIIMIGTLKRYFDYRLRTGCRFPSATLLGEKSDWKEILHKVQYLPKLVGYQEFLAPACHAPGQHGSVNNICNISGWITAFCFFKETGQRTPEYSDEELGSYADLTTIDQQKRLILGDVVYPIIHPSSIPKGVVSVSVVVENHETGLVHETTMVVGSVSMTLQLQMMEGA
ncbi:unnamed protein product [Tuber aestivum]|uniref:Uncharacterized protein n=1 Tax=Tuber aestivum TaxID=59557 RepID=A0A292PNR0_9PEZI|nr:unnamed protein product [Tuber aestivum]